MIRKRVKIRERKIREREYGGIWSVGKLKRSKESIQKLERRKVLKGRVQRNL